MAAEVSLLKEKSITVTDRWRVTQIPHLCTECGCTETILWYQRNLLSSTMRTGFQASDRMPKKGLEMLMSPMQMRDLSLVPDLEYLLTIKVALKEMAKILTAHT